MRMCSVYLYHTVLFSAMRGVDDPNRVDLKE